MMKLKSDDKMMKVRLPFIGRKAAILAHVLAHLRARAGVVMYMVTGFCS